MFKECSAKVMQVLEWNSENIPGFRDGPFYISQCSIFYYHIYCRDVARTSYPFATFIHFYSPMGTNAAFSNAKPRRQMMKKGTSNEEDRQAWIRFVNRINWVRWKHARLCLLHFDDTYIKYEPEVTANLSYPCWCHGPSLPSGEHDINIPAKCPSGFHPGKQISQWR